MKPYYYHLSVIVISREPYDNNTNVRYWRDGKSSTPHSNGNEDAQQIIIKQYFAHKDSFLKILKIR